MSLIADSVCFKLYRYTLEILRIISQSVVFSLIFACTFCHLHIRGPKIHNFLSTTESHQRKLLKTCYRYFITIYLAYGVLEVYSFISILRYAL